MAATGAGPQKARGEGSGGRAEKRWQEWLHARARLMPGLLIESPSWVRQAFEHDWAPMQALARQVKRLPPALAGFLLGYSSGFVAIATGESRYVPGPVSLRGREVHNVAFVSVADLARDNEQPLHVIGHLVDHHLGCGGRPQGRWLSEGGGVTPAWQKAGERLSGLFALGYGVDEVARSGVRDYFARSLALYCRDRRRLNVADPQIEKWLRNTLWNETFWQEQGLEFRGPGMEAYP